VITPIAIAAISSTSVTPAWERRRVRSIVRSL
jgi:hypothetical protein